MPEITVKIPDGDYCDSCPFCNEYTHKLIDIMGNETGNTKSGINCSRFNAELETEFVGCFQKVKKYYMCNMTEKQLMQNFALWALLFKIIDK